MTGYYKCERCGKGDLQTFNTAELRLRKPQSLKSTANYDQNDDDTHVLCEECYNAAWIMIDDFLEGER